MLNFEQMPLGQKIDVLRNELSKSATMRINTVEQFERLPQDEQDELLEIHHLEILVDLSEKLQVDLTPFYDRYMTILFEIAKKGQARGYDFSTGEAVEKHMSTMVFAKMFAGVK